MEDWDAVAKAINERLEETRQTQMEVASKAGVSLTTFRELQHNINARRRQARTLAAISEALAWPADYLGAVLRGERPQPHDDEAQDPVLRDLSAIHDELRALRERVDAVERRLAAESGQP